jgi:FkbM family methyltransferase
MRYGTSSHYMVRADMLPTAATLFERLPRILRRHRLMKAWMRMTGENPLQLVRIRNNSFGYADMRDGFLRLIVIDGDFEKDFFAVADVFLEQGGTFFDVGANHGLLSFGIAARHADKVQFHLFEPNQQLISSIQKSLEHYPLMHCRTNPVAVFDRAGVVSFLIEPDQTGISHISEEAGEQVPAITIDDYLDDTNISQIDLLKMDIEGYELAALRGARCSLTNRCIRAIYFEYFEKYLTRVQPPGDLLSFLDSLGYEVCFCRTADIKRHGGATHTVRDNLPGNGLPLLPIRGLDLPKTTDLLALPRENLVRILRQHGAMPHCRKA